MHRRKWLWTALVALPLGVAGVVYGQNLAQQADKAESEEGFTRPATGEKLPRPKCCPLNNGN